MRASSVNHKFRTYLVCEGEHGRAHLREGGRALYKYNVLCSFERMAHSPRSPRCHGRPLPCETRTTVTDRPCIEQKKAVVCSMRKSAIVGEGGG